jgi:malonyl-CoA O-methyltransferase
MPLIASFDRAQNYDRYAAPQRAAAIALAQRIAMLPLPPGRPALEIGCGTGLLTQHVVGQVPAARWVITDVAPAMLERARARLGAAPAAITWAQMDGEAPQATPGGYGLICSSLAFQWFADLPGAVARLKSLLAPGGWLAFATLAQGSFAQWRAAHGDLPCGLHGYPSLQALGQGAERLHLPQDWGSARGFLRHLKGIGAQVARKGYQPLSPAQLRSVMARFDAAGAHDAYEVALVCWQRLPGDAPTAAA